MHFGNSHSSHLLKQDRVTPAICHGKAGFERPRRQPAGTKRSLAKPGGSKQPLNKIRLHGPSRSASSRREAPGKQERAIWTACGQPGRHQGATRNPDQGGRKGPFGQPGRHQGGTKEAGKDLLDRLGETGRHQGARKGLSGRPGRHQGSTREAERTSWTACEAPGRQDRISWTACEAPGRHQGGRKGPSGQPGRHREAGKD